MAGIRVLGQLIYKKKRLSFSECDLKQKVAARLYVTALKALNEFP
jgi:hypothetical protein